MCGESRKHGSEGGRGKSTVRQLACCLPYRDDLGHWIGDGAEGANFWLSVISDLQARGVEDIFIACIDGLTGFKEAIHAVFPQTEIQRCIIHQIRHSLQYVAWKDRKAFVADLHRVANSMPWCRGCAAIQACSVYKRIAKLWIQLRNINSNS